MKYFLTFLLLVASTDAHKLEQKRIAETQQPFLIPDVMGADQATKWALCDGTNTGRCREADPFLAKEHNIPQPEHYVDADSVHKGLTRF